MTTEPFAHVGPNPTTNFDTLEDVGKPTELSSILTDTGYGLAIITSLNEAEIQKTFTAMAHSFEKEGRQTISFRTSEDSTPMPGVTEIYTNDIASSGRALFRFGSDKIIFMDSLDTKEKLTFALDASLVGGTVIAAVPARSSWDAIGRILSVPNVNPELLSNALVYVAYQDVMPGLESGIYLNTQILLADEDVKTSIASYKRRTR